MILRRARRADVPAIVALLQDDFLGATRETPKGQALPESYSAAFDEIDGDRRCELMVAEDEGLVVGTFHLTVLTHISFKGSKSLQIENVHVGAARRSHGVGRLMMEWAIARARELGCDRVQLTTNKLRKDAHRFYERLGFRATHEGMKLPL
jgi:N-acetylglutamate synthase-like GNAT family acetyltransferase